MTLYYDKNQNAVIENHPDDWIYYNDEGDLVLDFDEAPRDDKLTSLLNAAASAVEASDTYDLVEEPNARWAGGNE